MQSVRCAAYLVSDGRCVVCVPRSCGPAPPGTVWVPLTDPVVRYPWSLLWRADEQAAPLAAVRECARLTAAALGWLQ